MFVDNIRQEELGKYTKCFKEGESLFLEGDASQDLFILISGELDIIQGNRKIAFLKQTGSLFGEMSFLLGAKRSATTKAATDVVTICIPKEEITTFLQDFPEAAREISKVLAERLDESNRILYGLQEFGDQIPDALILTDKFGHILCWNASAETLYGREWKQMKDRPVEGIYRHPDVYRSYLTETGSSVSIREKVLEVNHPEKGIRYASTSMTLLYDGSNELIGVLTLARDVTAVKKLEKKYKAVRNWLLFPLLIAGLIVLMLFYGYPKFFRSTQVVSVKKVALKDRIFRDHLLLNALIASPFKAGQKITIDIILKDFMKAQKESDTPYSGIVVLDSALHVFTAYSARYGQKSMEMAGVTYAGVDFPQKGDATHHILILYRSNPEDGRTERGIEIAFMMKAEDTNYGWLVFQLDMEFLMEAYELDENELQQFEFEDSRK